MSIPNYASEVQELLEMLWANGYCAFRMSGPNRVDSPDVDVVAFRRGEVRFIQVVVLSAGNSKKSVGDKGDAIDRLVHSTMPFSHTRDFDVDGFFAVKSAPSDKWLWANRSSSYIKFGDDYKPMKMMI